MLLLERPVLWLGALPLALGGGAAVYAMLVAGAAELLEQFLRGAALGAATVPVLPIIGRNAMAANQGIPGRFVVVINLFGGNGFVSALALHAGAFTGNQPFGVFIQGT